MVKLNSNGMLNAFKLLVKGANLKKCKALKKAAEIFEEYNWVEMDDEYYMKKHSCNMEVATEIVSAIVGKDVEAETAYAIANMARDIVSRVETEEFERERELERERERMEVEVEAE